jgi:hypothetical protein
VLGHEHIAASSPVQLLEGGLVATTVAAPLCRRPGLPSCSSVSTPVSLLLLLLASVLAFGGLASEPGMFAYAALCCCCSAHSCAIMLLLLCSSLCCDAVAVLQAVQSLVQDSVKKFLTELDMFHWDSSQCC